MWLTVKMMHSLAYLTSNWKFYLTLTIVVIFIYWYLKHKLTFWSKQQIPNDLFLVNSWFIDSINEMDQINTKKMGRVFGWVQPLSHLIFLSITDINEFHVIYSYIRITSLLKFTESAASYLTMITILNILKCQKDLIASISAHMRN